MNYEQEITWLKTYLKEKPWANWAKRQLAEIKGEMSLKNKNGQKT